MARGEELTKVNVMLEKIGCKAIEVEKEADDLFEAAVHHAARKTAAFRQMNARSRPPKGLKRGPPN